MAKVIYMAFFPDVISSTRLKSFEGERRLEKRIEHEHVTFAFRPEELFPESLMRNVFTLMVIGYGNDGENSGFEVALPEDLIPYYKGQDTIHITTSLSGTGKAINTSKLAFEPITPFPITGMLGYYMGKGFLFTNALDSELVK